MNRSFIPRKNQIILAILAMSLLADQPMIAQDKSQSGAASRIKKEYQAFKEAFACARQKGFRACSREQKLRIVAAGAALLALVGSSIYLRARSLSRWKERLKKERERVTVAELRQIERGFGNPLDDNTLLVIAAQRGYLRAAQQLIEGGADVNFINRSDNTTPLWRAVRNGHDKIVQLLIEKDADVNLGKPLFEAALHGRLSIAKSLLDAGALVNVRGEGKATPLHWAARRGHLEVVRLFITKGADVNTRDEWGEVPLHYVVIPGYLETVKLLLGVKGIGVNIKDNDGDTALHKATRYSEKDVIELLIEKGADLFAKNKKGQTPLDVAKNEKIKALIQGSIDFRWALGQRVLQEKLGEAFERAEKRTGGAPELEKKILEQAYPEEAERRAKQRKAEVEKQNEVRKNE